MNSRNHRWPLTVLLIIAAGSVVLFLSRSTTQRRRTDEPLVRAWEIGPEGEMREILPLPIVNNDNRYYVAFPTRERFQHIQIEVDGKRFNIVATSLLPSELPKTHKNYRPFDYVPEEIFGLGELPVQVYQPDQ